MPSCQTRHTIYLHQMCITKAKLAKCFMVPGRHKKYFLSTCNSLQAEGRARGRGGGGRGRGRGQNVTTEDGGLVQFTTHCFFGFFGCGPPFQVKFGHCNFILAVGTCGYNIPTFSRFNFWFKVFWFHHVGAGKWKVDMDAVATNCQGQHTQAFEGLRLGHDQDGEVKRI